MSYKNRLLQGVGVAIIIISLAAIAYSTQAVQNGVISIFQPPNTITTSKSTSKTAATSNPSTISVKVPAGAGREGFLQEFFVPSRVNLHVGNTIKWIDTDTQRCMTTRKLEQDQLLLRINGTLPDTRTLGNEEKSERAAEIKQHGIVQTPLVLFEYYINI